MTETRPLTYLFGREELVRPLQRLWCLRARVWCPPLRQLLRRLKWYEPILVCKILISNIAEPHLDLCQERSVTKISRWTIIVRGCRYLLLALKARSNTSHWGKYNESMVRVLITVDNVEKYPLSVEMSCWYPGVFNVEAKVGWDEIDGFVYFRQKFGPWERDRSRDVV